MPEVSAQLHDILRRLESHYEDIQDTEFTVEQGRLYMLQTRNAKRPAQAAVRFAVDAVSEGLLAREEFDRWVERRTRANATKGNGSNGARQARKPRKGVPGTSA